VDLSEPRAERPKLERAPQENSVFIGNLDFAVQDEQLIEMCSDLVGPDSVARVRLATDRDTGTATTRHQTRNSPPLYVCMYSMYTC
jgi:hypothetical protein